MRVQMLLLLTMIVMIYQDIEFFHAHPPNSVGSTLIELNLIESS